MTAQTYMVRERIRRGYSREAQGYAVWHEYQVVQGRRVVGRFDLERQAHTWIDRQTVAADLERMIAEELASPKPCPDLLAWLRQLAARVPGAPAQALAVIKAELADVTARA